MSNELFKTIEAQGRLITELRAENEELKEKIEEQNKLISGLVHDNLEHQLNK